MKKMSILFCLLMILATSLTSQTVEGFNLFLNNMQVLAWSSEVENESGTVGLEIILLVDEEYDFVYGVDLIAKLTYVFFSEEDYDYFEIKQLTAKVCFLLPRTSGVPIGRKYFDFRCHTNYRRKRWEN
jgi:hypothetical protein